MTRNTEAAESAAVPPDAGSACDFSSIRSAATVVPRVLSLSCLYPNPAQPGMGLFVERRLQHLAKLLPLEVVAPFAITHYGGAKGKRIRFGKGWCPPSRKNGNVDVVHPRWAYLPLAGGLTALFLFAAMLIPLVRIRRRFSFDILDTHFGHPEGSAGCLLSLALGVPFTMTFRGSETRHGGAGVGRVLMRLAVRRASRVFAVSERLRQFAIELGADPANVKTIPNGVDTGVFFPRDQSQCRLRHGLPLDRPLILSAGALVERKGHHRIAEVLRTVAVSGPPPVLLIAGAHGPEGQYERTIRKVVADLELHDSVRFLGPLPAEALAEVMSAADVLCLSSTNEGWPNVVHEALACGTPIVATDVGAVPDMLGDGQYGFVIPVNEPVALQEALQSALGQTWDHAAIAAWGRSRSWCDVAREVFTEFQQITIENSIRGA